MPGQGAADRVREALGLPVRRGVPSPPRVEIALPGAVPGSVVRIAAALAVVGLVVLAAPPGFVVAAAVVGAGVGLWRPALPVAPVTLVVVGIVVLAGPDLLVARGDAGGVLRACALVLCGHVALRLGALAARVAWRGRVDRAVLGVVARSVLGVQLLVQAVLAVAVVRSVDAAGGLAGHGWLRLLAVAAVVGVALLVVPRAWLRTGWRRDVG